MNSLLDHDDDDDAPSGNEHELTLSTGTILGIFAGLALLCGLFFGFGYKMGSHKAAPPVQAVVAPENLVVPSANFSAFKPAAGSPVAGPVTPAPVPSITPAKTPVSTEDGETAAIEQTPHTTPTAPIHAAPEPPTPVVAAGSFVVQVAAFTHPEDADLLVHALKAKGYPAFARSEPQDKLQHIQVGPFSNRKDAEAAKQRLLVDGYQPILK
jgi:DedD protein